MSTVDTMQLQWHPITERPTYDCKVVLYIVGRDGRKDAELAEFWHGFLVQYWCNMDRDDDATVLAWSLCPDPICPNPETSTSSV